MPVHHPKNRHALIEWCRANPESAADLIGTAVHSGTSSATFHSKIARLEYELGVSPVMALSRQKLQSMKRATRAANAAIGSASNQESADASTKAIRDYAVNEVDTDIANGRRPKLEAIAQIIVDLNIGGRSPELGPTRNKIRDIAAEGRKRHARITRKG